VISKIHLFQWVGGGDAIVVKGDGEAKRSGIYSLKYKE
jgi:hypothetical protein